MSKLPIPFLLVFLAMPAASAPATDRSRDDFAELLALIDRLESKIPRRDCSLPDVSKVDVAWHLDHSLKVVNSIHGELSVSDPQNYRPNFNPLRILVFTTGKLARGKGKAPDFTKPPATIRTEDIRSQLDTARQNLSAIPQMAERSHFRHPAFGVLHRDRAIRFLAIHTQHHLSIVDDILAGCSGT